MNEIRKVGGGTTEHNLRLSDRGVPGARRVSQEANLQKEKARPLGKWKKAITSHGRVLRIPLTSWYLFLGNRDLRKKRPPW